MRAGPLLALLLTAAMLAGCAGPASPGFTTFFARGRPAPIAYAPPDVVVAPGEVPIIAPGAIGSDAPYTLDSGDKLRVTVFGQDGITNTYIVDAGGNVTLPLIGSVPARGLTSRGLSAAIAERLRAGFIREPHVAVEIESYRPFFILGEVTAPGQYPFVPNMTVETAVAIAGGFTPRALRGPVRVSHAVGGQTVLAIVPLTMPVRPGDTISVDERWF